MTQAQIEAHSDAITSGRAHSQATLVCNAISSSGWLGATIGEIERSTGIPKHLITARIKELMDNRLIVRQVIGLTPEGKEIPKRRDIPDPQSGVRQTIHYSATLDAQIRFSY